MKNQSVDVVVTSRNGLISTSPSVFVGHDKEKRAVAFIKTWMKEHLQSLFPETDFDTLTVNEVVSIMREISENGVSDEIAWFTTTAQ